MKLVFDIGSNIGKTAEIFSNKSEKVICFEPNPSLADHLIQKFSGKNVIVDRRGISNGVGKKIFKISNADTISTFSEDWITNSRFSRDYIWRNEVEVETTTLNEIINQYGQPDYIKIDVEGHEFEVLTSFDTVLENTLVCFEWAEEQKEKIIKILNHIKNLGYSKFYFTEADDVTFEDSIVWRNFESLGLIEILNSDRKEKWGMVYFKK